MRTALAALLLGAALASAGTVPAAAESASGSAPRVVNQSYSIPAGGVADLGALPVLGSLGLGFARLLGQ